MNNFNFKEFLMENKLGPYAKSKVIKEGFTDQYDIESAYELKNAIAAIQDEASRKRVMAALEAFAKELKYGTNERAKVTETMLDPENPTYEKGNGYESQVLNRMGTAHTLYKFVGTTREGMKSVNIEITDIGNGRVVVDAGGQTLPYSKEKLKQSRIAGQPLQVPTIYGLIQVPKALEDKLFSTEPPSEAPINKPKSM